MRYSGLLFVVVAACASPADSTDTTESARFGGSPPIPNNFPIINQNGLASTFSTAGSISQSGPFNQSFGTNGRTCNSCHKDDQGWTVSTLGVQLQFLLTLGTDPLFRTVDGSNNPNDNTSSFQARARAYSMLLDRGVIRIGIGVPAGADFTLVAVDDPYGFASAEQLSLFRRPVPSTNLTFDSDVMWDGREVGSDLDAALASQANDATLGHAQATQPLDPVTNAAVVDFESGLYTAQTYDFHGGSLDAGGALGGPENLASQAIVAQRWDLFDAWATSTDPNQASIYRGQELFNTRTRTTGGGPCQGCHSQQNEGANRNGTFFNVHTADAVNREADQPLYTFEQVGTGTQIQVSDPGRALISAKFADIGKFKPPGLRGLSLRAPYFHGGSAKTLRDVVEFYEANVNFEFTADEEDDLVNFLSAL